MRLIDNYFLARDEARGLADQSGRPRFLTRIFGRWWVTSRRYPGLRSERVVPTRWTTLLNPAV